MIQEYVDSNVYYKYEYINHNLSKVLDFDDNIIKEFTYNGNLLTRYQNTLTNIDKQVTYDTYGNMISFGNTIYQYDSRNLLTRVIDNNNQYNYYYDYEGIRLKKEIIKNNVIETTKYIYDGNIILAEEKEVNNMVNTLYYFYEANNINVIKYHNKYYKLRRDALGNISDIVYNDKIVGKYTYDAWGNTTITIDTNGLNTTDIDDARYVIENNPFRYKGYYYDVETSLYYITFRYYDPEIGRFISPDSVDYLDPTSINGLNLYAYCNNDPVNYCDPSGHFAISAFLGIIIGVIALAATANDIYQIASGNVNVDKNKTNSENVSIENSYKILTPWMRYGYSFYLNHFNPNTKDVIQGSTAGVQFEWELHNYAAWVGIGGDSAKHLDVGKSIFVDGKAHPFKDKNGNITPEGIMSLGMRIGYIIFGNPLYWIWDLIVNGGF